LSGIEEMGRDHCKDEEIPAHSYYGTNLDVNENSKTIEDSSHDTAIQVEDIRPT
jgi:hypothetical protein